MDIDIQRDRARSMRKKLTAAEGRLWWALRGRSLGGYRFNRQVEIGPYIVDFLCRDKALVVEVDGATHSDQSEIQADHRRTMYLESRGLVVFRAWNGDVFTNLGGVLDGILLALENRTG
jgi:very-short-patch-repair endonuclease